MYKKAVLLIRLAMTRMISEAIQNHSICVKLSNGKAACYGFSNYIALRLAAFGYTVAYIRR